MSPQTQPFELDLPANWSRCQLRRVARIENGAEYKSVEVPEGGYPVFGSGGEFARASEYLATGPSVLFGRKGTIDKPLLVNEPFWTADTMFYSRLLDRVAPRFLHYYATTIPFGFYSTSTALPSMTQSDLLGHCIPLPMSEEQERIADFLDRETARIDTLIDKQEKLIETLRERVAALLEATLISAESVPGTRLKHFVLGVRQGWSPQCHPWPTDGVEHWAVLKTGCANGGLFKPEENKELPVSEIPRASTVVQPGEIIVSRANTRELVGSAAVVLGEFPKLMLSDKLYSFRVDRERALPQFLAATLGTRRIRDAIELEATGSSPSMLNVSRDEILNLPVELPDIQMQNRLWREVNERCGKIDILVSKAQEFIKLAKERRSALITAAVTGQIDVMEDAGG